MEGEFISNHFSSLSVVCLFYSLWSQCRDKQITVSDQKVEILLHIWYILKQLGSHKYHIL